MRRLILVPVLALAALVTTANFAVAYEVEDAQISAADKAAFDNFRLTDDFIGNYLAYSEEAAKNPCELSPVFALQQEEDESRSLDQTIAAFDAQPGVHAALQRNNLTAREMILGLATLTMAAMQNLAGEHPELFDEGEMSEQVTVSPENMAVYKRHEAAMQSHQMKLARQMQQAASLPDCLK